MTMTHNFATRPYFSLKDCDGCQSDCDRCNNGTVRWEISKCKPSIINEAIANLKDNGTCDGCSGKSCYDCQFVLDQIILLYGTRYR